MAKKKKQGGGGGIVSTNPDSFVAAGLPDDFSGVITEARYVPWDYDGRAEQFGWILTARLTITPDEDSDIENEVVAYYAAASDLDHFVPGDADGNPVDIDDWDEEDIEEVEGVTAVRIGRREALANNSNWAFWLKAISEAGFTKHRQWSGNLADDLEGLRVHMNRVAQPTRKGLEGSDGKARDILVVTQILGDEAGGGGGKKAKKSSKKASKVKAKAEVEDDEDEDEEETATTSGGDDLESRLEAAVVELLTDAEEAMSLKKVTTKVIKSFKGAERAKALKMMGDEDFYGDEDRPWEYDEDDETLEVE